MVAFSIVGVIISAASVSICTTCGSMLYNWFSRTFEAVQRKVAKNAARLRFLPRENETRRQDFYCSKGRSVRGGD